MPKFMIVGAIATSLLAAAGLSWGAEESESAAALAKALSQASVPLEQGLKASEREGKPISGKFEVEDGALQLSVYTMKNGAFEEVIVDHQSGTVKKAEKITDEDDLKDAQAQSQVMEKARLPLAAAVEKAMKANAGYKAVSVMPNLTDGKAVAEVQLLKGDEIKKVSEALDETLD